MKDCTFQKKSQKFSYFRPIPFSVIGGLVALPSPFHANCSYEKSHFSPKFCYFWPKPPSDPGGLVALPSPFYPNSFHEKSHFWQKSPKLSYFRPKPNSDTGGLVALPSSFHLNCFHAKSHFLAKITKIELFSAKNRFRYWGPGGPASPVPSKFLSWKFELFGKITKISLFFGQNPLQIQGAWWLWRGLWPKIATFWWVSRKVRFFMKAIWMKQGRQSHQAPPIWIEFWPKLLSPPLPPICSKFLSWKIALFGKNDQNWAIFGQYPFQLLGAWWLCLPRFIQIAFMKNLTFRETHQNFAIFGQNPL